LAYWIGLAGHMSKVTQHFIFSHFSGFWIELVTQILGKSFWLGGIWS